MTNREFGMDVTYSMSANEAVLQRTVMLSKQAQDTATTKSQSSSKTKRAKVDPALPLEPVANNPVTSFGASGLTT